MHITSSEVLGENLRAENRVSAFLFVAATASEQGKLCRRCDVVVVEVFGCCFSLVGGSMYGIGKFGFNDRNTYTDGYIP